MSTSLQHLRIPATQVLVDSQCLVKCGGAAGTSCTCVKASKMATTEAVLLSLRVDSFSAGAMSLNLGQAYNGCFSVSQRTQWLLGSVLAGYQTTL